MTDTQTDNQANRPATEFDTKALQQLTDELAILNRHRFIRIHNSLWRLVWFQLVRGLAFGLGTALGATALVSLLGWWLAQFELIPVLGDWVQQISLYLDLPEPPTASPHPNTD